MNSWTIVLFAGGLSFALKFAGYLVPERYLQHPRVAQAVTMLPVALLAGLIVVQSFADGRSLSLDARSAGLAAAVIALLLRAPFIVVVIVAAAVAAGCRALGWG